MSDRDVSVILGKISKKLVDRFWEIVSKKVSRMDDWELLENLRMIVACARFEDWEEVWEENST